MLYGAVTRQLILGSRNTESQRQYNGINKADKSSENVLIALKGQKISRIHFIVFYIAAKITYSTVIYFLKLRLK